MKNIQRITLSDWSSTFHNYQENPVPVVLTDSPHAHLAMKKWTPEFFENLNCAVKVAVHKNDGLQVSHYEEMHLSQFIQHWKNSETTNSTYYLSNWNFAAVAPQLKGDFEAPEVVGKDHFEDLPEEMQIVRTWLFFGSPHVATYLHSDIFGTSTWVTMIQGHKVFRYMLPEGNKHVTPELDLFSDEGLAFVQSQGLDVYEAELGPGDTLLLPGNHPHQVKNLDNNIMLTSNYIAPQDLPYSLSTIASEYAKPLFHVLSQMAAALQEPSGSRYLTDAEFLNHQKKIFGNLLLKYNNLYTTIKTLAARHEESLQK